MFILNIIHATKFILYVSLILNFSSTIATAQPEFEERANPLFVGISLGVATAMATVILIVLKKYCKPIRGVQGQDIDGSDHWANVGLDPLVVETFPVFKYSDVVHHRGGTGPLECSVCLSSFEVVEDDDGCGGSGGLLCLLPKCNHVFHVGCVGPWFKGHTTCPLCRADLVPEYDELSQPDSSHVLGSGNGEGVEVNGISSEIEAREDIEEGQVDVKYKRWKSTGHVTEVKWVEEDSWKRFTLKLPEEKIVELVEKTGKHKRARSS